MSKQDLGVVLVPACGIGPLAAHLRRVPITTTWVTTSLSPTAGPAERPSGGALFLPLARLETRLLGLTGNLPATAWALYSGPRTPAPPYPLSDSARHHHPTPLCVRFWVSGRRSPSPRNRTRARAERDFDIPTAPGAPRAPPSSGGVARRQLQRPRARCGRWEGRRGGPG